jgi:hypothetical protein
MLVSTFVVELQTKTLYIIILRFSPTLTTTFEVEMEMFTLL